VAFAAEERTLAQLGEQIVRSLLHGEPELLPAATMVVTLSDDAAGAMRELTLTLTRALTLTLSLTLPLPPYPYPPPYP